MVAGLDVDNKVSMSESVLCKQSGREGLAVLHSCPAAARQGAAEGHVPQVSAGLGVGLLVTSWARVGGTLLGMHLSLTMVQSGTAEQCPVLPATAHAKRPYARLAGHAPISAHISAALAPTTQLLLASFQLQWYGALWLHIWGLECWLQLATKGARSV